MKRKSILLLLAILITVSFTACSEETSVSGEESIESEVSETLSSEEEIGYETAFPSTELFQFTVKIDDNLYMLPAMQTAFSKNGWAVSEVSASVVKASYQADAVLSKGETAFDIKVVNPTKEDLPFQKCPIGRISYDFSGDAQISIADEFSLNDATKKTVIEKFGEPETTETHSDFTEITYGSRSTSGNYARYLFRFDKNGKITYFNIVNYYMPK